MIEIKNIDKSFNDKKVLKNISFNIQKGEVHFIIGRSGSGKTVLAKNIVGLIRPTSGEVLFDKKNITKLTEKELFTVRKKITYVFQHSTLFDFMTIYQNIEFPILKHNKKIKKLELSKKVEHYIKELHLTKFKDRYPAEVGLAIQKKTAIARALAMNPEYIIYDEPTTGLEYRDARDIDSMILEMSRKLNITAIVISHDLKSIFSIADKITLIDNGKLIISDKLDNFLRSNHKIVKDILSIKDNF